MSTPTNERLYALLPAIYKLRDAAQGEPLRALLDIIDTQLQRVEQNTTDLYENWFIETCDEWVVPYIGDLLAVRAKFPVDPNAMSLRPFVANTLDYRRRKGTAAMLEGLARDVTNWPARAVEFFELLPTNENLNHVRATAYRNADLRDTDALERLSASAGAFETTGHFVDVRRIATRGGKYNLPNVGLFLWRLDAFVADVVDEETQQQLMVPAVPDGAAPAVRWRFDPLGRDSVLFNPSRTVEERRVLESDVPGPLRLRAVYDELENARAAWAAHGEIAYAYLASSEPALGVHVVGEAKPLDPLEIQICDLSNWGASLPPSKTITRTKSGGGTESIVTRVAIDPRLGRLAFIDNTTKPKAVRVRFAYGFSGDLGGGFYSRLGALTDPGARKLIEVSVADQTAAVDGALKTAINNWDPTKDPNALIEIQDGGFYDVADVTVPANASLEIRARDNVRPVLKPSATWNLSLGAESHLRLDGLLVSGAKLSVTTSDAPNELDHDLTLSHVTLDPASSGVTFAAAAVGRLTLTIQKSIVGPIALGSTVADSSRVVVASDSIVQSIDQATDAQLDRVTVLGAVETHTIEASDCIFAGGLTVERTQEGCVRFSFVPDGSRAPRCYRCQPSLAIQEAGLDANSPAAALIKTRLVPEFTSQTYGVAGYAQLALDGPDEIATGASNGSEMGAFQFLLAPQRRANLLTALDEYLRFGLEAGLFFPT